MRRRVILLAGTIVAWTLLSATDAWAVNTIVGYDPMPADGGVDHHVELWPDDEANPPGFHTKAVRCTKDRRVKLQERDGDEWDLVKRGQTDDTGHALIHTGAVSGTFRVLAPKHPLGDGTVCYREVSERMRL